MSMCIPKRFPAISTVLASTLALVLSLAAGDAVQHYRERHLPSSTATSRGHSEAIVATRPVDITERAWRTILQYAGERPHSVSPTDIFAPGGEGPCHVLRASWTRKGIRTDAIFDLNGYLISRSDECSEASVPQEVILTIRGEADKSGITFRKVTTISYTGTFVDETGEREVMVDNWFVASQDNTGKK